MEELLSENDIIEWLRTRTIPFSYSIHPWNKGKYMTDMMYMYMHLHSILFR